MKEHLKDKDSTAFGVIIINVFEYFSSLNSGICVEVVWY